MDAGSEFITGSEEPRPATGPTILELPALADPLSQTLTADKIYDSKKNREHLEDQRNKKRDYSQSGGVKGDRLSRQRGSGPGSNRKFAEAKKYHGLRRSRYWGLAMMSIQTFMVGIVLNLKRWVRLTADRSGSNGLDGHQGWRMG